MGWRSWINLLNGFIGVVVALPILLQLVTVLRGSLAGGNTQTVRAETQEAPWQSPGDVCQDMARSDLPHTPEGFEDGGYNLSAPATFTPGKTLTVKLRGKYPFHHYRLQVRCVSDSHFFGVWSNVPPGDILVTCSTSHDTLTNYRQGLWQSLTVSWYTDYANHHPVQIIAQVHDGRIWRKIASAYIHKKTSHEALESNHDTPGRKKRDAKQFIEKTDVQEPVTSVSTSLPTLPFNQKAVTTPGDVQEVTDNQTKAQRKEKKKSGGVDGNSLFYLLTVIASYVGMYTIFSFLLI